MNASRSGLSTGSSPVWSASSRWIAATWSAGRADRASNARSSVADTAAVSTRSSPPRPIIVRSPAWLAAARERRERNDVDGVDRAVRALVDQQDRQIGIEQLDRRDRHQAGDLPVRGDLDHAALAIGRALIGIDRLGHMVGRVEAQAEVARAVQPQVAEPRPLARRGARAQGATPHAPRRARRAMRGGTRPPASLSTATARSLTPHSSAKARRPWSWMLNPHGGRARPRCAATSARWRSRRKVPIATSPAIRRSEMSSLSRSACSCAAHPPSFSGVTSKWNATPGALFLAARSSLSLTSSAHCWSCRRIAMAATRAKERPTAHRYGDRTGWDCGTGRGTASSPIVRPAAPCPGRGGPASRA